MAFLPTLDNLRDRLQMFSAETTNLYAICDAQVTQKTDVALICASSHGRPPPTSLRPTLPTEVLDIVFAMLSKENLKPLLYANSFISALALRRLYHDVVLDRPAIIVAFLQTVLASDRLPLLVRRLDINASRSETNIAPTYLTQIALSTDLPLPKTHKIKAIPTRNFYMLLAKGLRSMRRLVSLTIELPKTHTPLWIFDDCTFHLRQFTTSMYCRRPLARFLEAQPSITDLTLRGYQTDSLMLLPFMHPVMSTIQPVAAVPADVELGKEVFSLSPDALPNLRTFNVVHADADLVRSVVSGRPVEIVSLPLFPERSLASLDALQASSAPLKRLSVISFDPTAAGFLFEALARRFVDLEALHLVMLMAEYDKESLEQSAHVLSAFRRLKYITYMAAPAHPTPIPSIPFPTPPTMSSTANPNITTPPSTTPIPNPNPTAAPTRDVDASKGEADIAVLWHGACPTLRTIILPEGRVWFQKSAPQPAVPAAGAACSSTNSAGPPAGGDVQPPAPVIWEAL